MKLPNRLRLISDKVEPCAKVCDIGTDHAYVPIDLIKKGKCTKAVATDIKKGPILKAEKNIERFKLNDCIEIRQGYGLEPIAPGECDSIVIAGMGGVLITEILKKGFLVAKAAKMLIIQPMYAQEVLRRWLYENGFEIFDEALVAEKRKIYVVICARYTGVARKTSKMYYRIGELLVKKKDPLLPAYISRLIAIQEKVVSGFQKAKTLGKDEIEMHKKILEEIKTLFTSIEKRDENE